MVHSMKFSKITVAAVSLLVLQSAFTVVGSVNAATPTTKPIANATKVVVNLDPCDKKQEGSRVRASNGKTFTCRNLGFRWTEDVFAAPAGTPATKPGGTTSTTAPIPKTLNGTFSGALIGGAVERQWEGTVTLSGPTNSSARAYGLKTATVQWKLTSRVPNCIGEVAGVSTVEASGQGSKELAVGGGLFILNADKTYAVGIRGTLNPRPAFPCPDGSQTIEVDANWELASTGSETFSLIKGRAIGERDDGTFRFKWDIPTT